MTHPMRVSTLALLAALAAGPVSAQEAAGVASSQPAAEATPPVLPEPFAPLASQVPAAGTLQEVLEAASEPVASEAEQGDVAPEDVSEAQDALPVEEDVPADMGAEVTAVEEDVAPDPMEAPAVPEAAAIPEAPVESEPAPEAETVPAEAQHGLYEEIGASGDWTAIRFQPTPDRTVCAIFSRPTDSIITEDGNAIAALRGERAAFITWESGVVDENAGVFSAIIGAPLDTNFEGHGFATDTENFSMFGHDDRLYVEPESDAEAIAAIRRGLSLTLTATLPGGRQAQDTYSLRGVQASTELAKEACPAASE